jgi:hypothetical protein
MNHIHRLKAIGHRISILKLNLDLSVSLDISVNFDSLAKWENLVEGRVRIVEVIN